MILHSLKSSSFPELFDRLREIVGETGLIHNADELLVYECDGYTIEKNRPDVVVFPTTTEQVVQIVKACNEADVPFLPRGAGTSLAGGCLPVGGGVMIALTRMKRILEVNTRDRYAVVEPGVVNLWLTRHLQPRAGGVRAGGEERDETDQPERDAEAGPREPAVLVDHPEVVAQVARRRVNELRLDEGRRGRRRGSWSRLHLRRGQTLAMARHG